MKNFRSLLFYFFTIVGFAFVVYWITKEGDGLESAKSVISIVKKSSPFNLFTDTFFQNIGHPLAMLLLQIITIIVISKIFAMICKRISQPTVIGEIVAGIFLGPSFLGMYFPQYFHFLFPPESLGNLHFLSQIGLILFMFVVGMELDLKVVKTKANNAVIISHASIVIPFALGMGLAYFLYLDYAPKSVRFIAFALFFGIAMSITAFPVLARIVRERGLSKTKLGSVIITCAATDDITAWCILAAVIAIVKAGSFVSSLYTIGIAILFVIFMLAVVQPFLKKYGNTLSSKENLSKPIVAIFFVILLTSAYATELIGIHALFGAFLAGVIMPPNKHFRSIFIEKVEDIALVLLLPLFFVFTGLRTQIGLLNDLKMWEICGWVIMVAVVGKFMGSAIAARVVGQKWRDSLIVGALMNTRGLMELIVLNIGYDLGILSPEIFAMFVIMALVTTFLTGPSLDLINYFLPEKLEEVDDVRSELVKYRILLPFGNPGKGKNMLRVANCMVGKSINKSSVMAFHLSPSPDLNQYNLPEYERECFEPIKQEAQKMHLPILSIFQPTLDVAKDIIDMANNGTFDLMIVGVGQSVFEGTLFGKLIGFGSKIINPEKLLGTITGKEKLFETKFFDDMTVQIIRNTKIPLGVFIDNNLTKIDKIVIPFYSISDSFLFIYAQKIINNSNIKIDIIDPTGVINQNPEIKNTIRSIEESSPERIALYNQLELNDNLSTHYELLLITLDSWKRNIESGAGWIQNAPSVLIIKP